MVLGGYLEQRRERFGVLVHSGADLFCDLVLSIVSAWCSLIAGGRKVVCSVVTDAKTGEGGRKRTTDMLIYEQDTNVLSLAGELFKGCLDGGGFGLLVDDEVVLLAVGRVGDVLFGVLSAQAMKSHDL